MILVIDNYDSFTFNLVHYLMELGAEVEVVRNDAISAGQAISSGAKGFLISPGPCTPNEAGISLDLVAACADRALPLLGVCLGHQAIGQHFGGRVVRGGLMHGKTSPVDHDGTGLFAGFPAGTVSGAPKVRACQIIAELEPETRGAYAGGVGYFAPDGSVDSCIVLRTAVVKDGVMHVQAGAGIVADSDPAYEQRECEAKAAALLAAAREAARIAAEPGFGQ